MRLDLEQQLAILQVGDDSLTGFESVEPGVGPGGLRHLAALVDDDHLGQIEPPTGLEVIGIV